MATFTALQRSHKKFTEKLVQFSCGLEEKVVEAVVIYARCLLKPDTGDIDEITFIRQLSYQFNLTNTYMLSLIFNALRKSRRSQVKSVTVEEYCKMIVTFLTPDLDLKIDFVFNVYDVDGDGFVNRMEVYAMLKTTVSSEDDEHEEVIKDLIEIVFKVVDRDNSGSIDLEEFRELVKKDVLYIELLGQCLPGAKEVSRFTLKISGKTSLQLKEMFQKELSATMVEGLKLTKSTEYYPIKLDL